MYCEGWQPGEPLSHSPPNLPISENAGELLLQSGEPLLQVGDLLLQFGLLGLEYLKSMLGLGQMEADERKVWVGVRWGVASSWGGYQGEGGLRGWQAKCCTFWISTVTQQALVPSLSFCPKMILSDTPLRASASEKAAAEKRTSIVSSKLALRRRETSLTLLMPKRLTGISLPLAVIQSARTARWRWLMYMLQGFRTSLISSSRHCRVASMPSISSTSERLLLPVRDASMQGLRRHSRRLLPTTSKTSSSVRLSKDMLTSSSARYAYLTLRAVLTDLMPRSPERKRFLTSISLCLTCWKRFRQPRREVPSEVSRISISGSVAAEMPLLFSISNQRPNLSLRQRQTFSYISPAISFSKSNFRMSTQGVFRARLRSSISSPLMLLMNQPESQQILVLTSRSFTHRQGSSDSIIRWAFRVSFSCLFSHSRRLWKYTVIRGVLMFFEMSRSSLRRGMPRVTFLSETPARWKVFRVI